MLHMLSEERRMQNTMISMSTPKIARIIQVQKLLNERQNIIILRNMKQNKGFEEESIL